MKLLLDQGVPRALRDAGFDAAADLILSVLDLCKDDLLHGALVSATQKQVRIRLLPLNQHRDNR